MNPYRDNAYHEPPRRPVPPWWRQLWDALLEHVRARWVHATCEAWGHAVARHTGALGWCARCRAPMALDHMKARRHERRPWVVVSVQEWEAQHRLSVAAGFDRPCAERARAREAGQN